MSEMSFEAVLRALEEIVERLESGDLSLEESLSCFTLGVQHATRCQELLKAVELQVETLLKQQDGTFAIGKLEE